MKSINAFIFAAALSLIGCSQDTSKPAYQGEKDPGVVKAFNEHVASSETGFSRSYRASQEGITKAVPEFYEAQQIFHKHGKDQWVAMSAELRPYIAMLSSKGRLMEVQLLSLMMVDRYLLPANGLDDEASRHHYAEELRHYLDVLTGHQSNDLDILTNLVLRLQQTQPDDDSLPKAIHYILGVAEKDRAMAQENMQSIQQGDETGFQAVSRRHYEQVLEEANYAYKMLAQVK